MFLFLVLCLIPIPASSDVTLKMIVMYGSTNNVSSMSQTRTSWENCTSLCYYDNNCLLAYQTSDICRMFQSGNITINKKSNNLVAFKLNSTDCPTNSSTAIVPISTEWTNGTYIFRKGITSSSNAWNFVYTISKCPVNSIMVTRKNTIVCVGIRIFSDLSPGNYTRAQALCKGNGGYSITGPSNPTEFTFFQSRSNLSLVQCNCQLFTDLSRTALSPLTQISNNENSLWVDGYCNATGVYRFDDDTHEGSGGYQFYTGEPNDGARAALMLYKSYQLGDCL
ncbi:hypothetical protein CRE_14006 [Caenorhabditis remanei]|uniref:PAN-3 domain-containing protein n=1 Tax=Caenorhabditis remanei TaxID=31234 RepID=E3M8S4_CAERE|nr:hypothetical protein CRE_14006 [Caenorhabditis remanei]